MMYEHQVICASIHAQIYNGSEFIAAFFNLGTCNVIYVFIVYCIHSTKIMSLKKI